MTQLSSNTPQIVITPVRAAAPATGGALDVLVRVQAPDAPAEAKPRPPLRLSLVVDRSGSMAGQPLQEALKCASHIAGRLSTRDQVSIVVYDEHVNVIAELQPAGDAGRFERLLSGIADGGSTALFDGWEAGARQLQGPSAETVSRVILLSDGQANAGLVDTDAVALHCRDAFEKGISTTTVGLGRNFNEDLMIRMARAGGGQQYYGQTADDLYDSFDSELQLLEALYARQVQVKLVAGTGVIVEPLAAAPVDALGQIALNDLAYGAEVWLLVRLHLGACGDASRRLLAVSASALGVDGVALEMVSPMLDLPVVDAAAWASLPQDELVLRRAAEVKMANAAEQVRQHLMQGRLDAAHAVLKSLEGLVEGHPWLKDKLEHLRELTQRDHHLAQKELAYSSRSLESRMVAKFEGDFVADETMRTDIPAYLRKKSTEGRGRRRP
jgi:Ca-activated chloride channel homolog